MADETTIEPTADDAGTTGDVLAEFAAEDDDKPKKPEARAAEPEEEDEEPVAPRKPKAKAKPEARAAAEEETEEEPEKPEPKRTYKQKVNGRDVELEATAVDTLAQQLGLDPKDILSGASLKRAAYEKMQEAAAIRKEFAKAQALVKSNPVEALRLLGLEPNDFDALAEQRTRERFSRQFDAEGNPLTPEQRELITLRAQQAEAEAQREAEAQKAKETEEATTRTQVEQHWIKTIVGHLEKSGDPKHIMPRVAAHLGAAIEADQSVDPADLLDDATALAWDDVLEEHAKLYDAMPFETIRGKFPGLVDKIRKGLVAEYKARQGGKQPDRQPEEQPRRRNGVRRPQTLGDIMDDFKSGR